MYIRTILTKDTVFTTYFIIVHNIMLSDIHHDERAPTGPDTKELPCFDSSAHGSQELAYHKVYVVLDATILFINDSIFSKYLKLCR